MWVLARPYMRRINVSLAAKGLESAHYAHICILPARMSDYKELDAEQTHRILWSSSPAFASFQWRASNRPVPSSSVYVLFVAWFLTMTTCPTTVICARHLKTC